MNTETAVFPGAIQANPDAISHGRPLGIVSPTLKTFLKEENNKRYKTVSM